MDVNVFDRKEGDSTGAALSAAQYNLTIGAVLLWGFAINWLMVKFIPVEAIRNINYWVFLIAYFAACFLGVYLFKTSSNPLVSFIGYNFVVVPFGLIINIVVSHYAPSLVLEAMRITGLVTLIMMVLGTIFPQFFQKIIAALSIALLVVIIVEWVEILFFNVHHGIIDWIVVLIFCGYIGYDWGRANSIPKTLDNAVDSAAALYMDIINLFLRILRILGSRKR